MKSVLLMAGLLSLGAAPPPPTAHVNAARMSEITRVLASDEFQGRAPGTAGEDKTIPYLIEQFKAAGLEPAGEKGGWTQIVPMIHTKLQAPANLSVSQSGKTNSLKFPDDLYLGTVRPVDRVRIANAPMVFVGYGVTAPERGWDDFKGVDVRGKVIVMLVNDPDFEAAAGEPVAGKFGGKTMTFYGRWVYKYEEAARRGAIAALIVHETDAAGYPWNVVKSPAGETYSIAQLPNAPQPVLLQGWMQQSVAAALLKSAGYDYGAVKRQARTAGFKPIDLKAAFRKTNIYYDIKPVETLNAKINPEGVFTHNSHMIMKDKLPGMIKAYPEGDKKTGTGLVFIVESFDKSYRKGNFWVVFFDIQSRKILFSDYCSGIPSGFGLRNYWAGSLKHVLAEIQILRYNMWKKAAVRDNQQVVTN